MAGSSAQLRRLGAELRRLREATGRTQTDVGKAIGRTHATLVNWERGKTKISKSDLVCLLAELRVPADVRKELDRLREESGQGSGGWAVYGLPDSLRPLVSFEEDAITETGYEPLVIPGLLQTEDYARTIHVAGPYITAPSDVDKWVAARMQRQLRLTDDDPLDLHVVLCEASLRIKVGGDAVMAAQLEKLRAATEAPNVKLQVLPAASGALPVICNFTVLHFRDASVDPPLGYFEGALGGYVVSDEGDVATMINMFEDLSGMALSEAESAAMIGVIYKDYR